MAETPNKRILSRVGIGSEDRDIYSTENLPASIWNSLKITWSGQFSRLVILGLMALVLMMPAVVWVFVAVTMATNVSTVVPYNLFDFMGYVSPTAAIEGLKTAEIIGNMEYYKNAMFEFSIMIPLIGIGSIGLGGLAYTSRLLLNKDYSGIFKGFFVGIKYTWLPALLTGIISGAALFLMIFCLYVFDAFALSVVAKIFALIGSILIFAVTTVFEMYAIMLSATYKMKLRKLFADSLAFTFGCLAHNLLWLLFVGIIVGLTVLVYYVLPTFFLGIWVVIFMVGDFFLVSLFMIISHSRFDIYINEQGSVRSRDAQLQKEMAARERNRQARLASKAAGEKPKQKQQATKFVNPKKKKKEATTQTNAEQKPFVSAKKGGYSEAELAQMEEDKKAALSASPEASEDFDASAYESD
ncbi:MAG: hypothetical protein J6Y68_00995 [Clostridia bacterium]|nr:hypothetical protein [Clostridia bacterium]